MLGAVFRGRQTGPAFKIAGEVAGFGKTQLQCNGRNGQGISKQFFNRQLLSNPRLDLLKAGTLTGELVAQAAGGNTQRLGHILCRGMKDTLIL